MRKYAEDLAKEYEFKNAEEYYQYIVDSLINGQTSQVRSLFNQMKPDSQQDFLINFLDPSEGYHKSTMNICIIELTK